MTGFADIDVVHILELVWIAPAAALLVTVTFSLCVLGATKSSDARRTGEGGSAKWLALAFASGIAVLGVTAAGISVIVAG